MRGRCLGRRAFATVFSKENVDFTNLVLFPARGLLGTENWKGCRGGCLHRVNLRVKA